MVKFADNITDDDLMDGFLAGDSSAMEALFLRYRQPVYTWLRQRLGDDSEADDVYQDVWLKILRNASGYERGNFRAWLWRIVRNQVTDRSRKMRPELTLDEPVGEDDAESAATTALDLVSDESAVTALERMADDERRAFVRSEIVALPFAQREVVELRIDAELEFREIAEVLGVSINTVLGTMWRGARVTSAREAVLDEEGEILLDMIGMSTPYDFYGYYAEEEDGVD